MALNITITVESLQNSFVFHRTVITASMSTIAFNFMRWLYLIRSSLAGKCFLRWDLGGEDSSQGAG